MTPDPADDEPLHAASPTAHLLDELQLYGCRTFGDDPNPRPLPEEAAVRGALAEMFDALAGMIEDTCLEPDPQDLLWSTVNVFHRMADRAGRPLDDNEQAQKRSQHDKDGSAVSRWSWARNA